MQGAWDTFEVNGPIDLAEAGWARDDVVPLGTER